MPVVGRAVRQRDGPDVASPPRCIADWPRRRVLLVRRRLKLLRGISFLRALAPIFAYAGRFAVVHLKVAKCQIVFIGIACGERDREVVAAKLWTISGGVQSRRLGNYLGIYNPSFCRRCKRTASC